jgi:hypothetical protein
MFVSLIYCAESTVRWFIMRKKHCWMAADSAANEQGLSQAKRRKYGSEPHLHWSPRASFFFPHVAFTDKPSAN